MSAPQRYRAGAYGAMVADDNGPWVLWSDAAVEATAKPCPHRWVWDAPRDRYVCTLCDDFITKIALLNAKGPR